MAIFRGGVKIFGSDIRLGITRDKSLDNIYMDPRFSDPEGGQEPDNPSLSATKPALINQMLQYIMQGEGLGRAGRFYTSFRLPTGSPAEITKRFVDGIEITETDLIGDHEQDSGFGNINQKIQNLYGKRVNAFCKSITMPDRTMTTVPVATGPGAPRHFVTDHTYAELTATFYADKYLRERQYFELWQKSAFNSVSNNYEFYDNYVSDIDLFNLGQFANDKGSSEDPAARDDLTHGIKLYECYPTSIGAPQLSYDNNDVITFDVTFKYRHWQNYFIGQTSAISLGQSGFGKSISSEDGRLETGSILPDWLPAELRRAGEGVLGDLKRRIPIGDLTGGRVFPPFF